MSLHGKTLLITGGSRGIGLAIALRAARDGANIALLAKTSEAHPSLSGTIHTAAAEIEAQGGHALAVQTDVRDADRIARAVQLAEETFGGIDILVNNASAIGLTGTENTTLARFDLMHAVNARGTFACTQACLPALRRSARSGRGAHVLNLSPPLTFDAKWLKPHIAYTMSKFGMTLCTLGHAAEFAMDGIAVNSLWPRTLISTAALRMVPGATQTGARTPQIMADAAWHILTMDPRATTGHCFLDEQVLQATGVMDFAHYASDPESRDLELDLFVDE